MPQFILTIDTGNAAMVYPCQIARALRDVAGKIREDSMYDLKKNGAKNIMGTNGKVVGHYEVI